MSLTEDWKEGLLFVEVYYFIKYGRETYVAYLADDNIFLTIHGNISVYDIEDDYFAILSPCDYEEMERLKNENEKLMKRCAILEKQGAGEKGEKRI